MSKEDCYRCVLPIHTPKDAARILMPFPDGSRAWVMFHPKCLSKWCVLATTPLYSHLFERKRERFLKTGVYCAFGTSTVYAVIP